ncbi:MAG TPA: class II aldolase/adducin family protein, partial [Quisquiliibacterium sp.]|nr:class II aldolase/adducin family protein [Quisquiliibacterium sp.]
MSGGPGPASNAVREPPAFACEDDARSALVDTCRAMNAQGVNQGRSGNASLRWDRGAAAGFLMTPSALAYERMTSDDIVWMSLDLAPGAADERAARIVDGARAPSTEWRMHRELHAARADVRAVVHTHSVHASALACLPAVQRDGIDVQMLMLSMH